MAVAGLGAAAVGVGVAARGGGGDAAGDLPKLPIGATGDAAAAESRVAADSLGFAPAGKYVPTDSLPTLGGTGPAYELKADVTEASVRELAAGLGISGDPTVDATGYWTVQDGEMSLNVNGPDGYWSLYPTMVVDPGEGAPDQPIDGIPHPTIVPDEELLCPDTAVSSSNSGDFVANEDTKPPEPCESPISTDDEQQVDPMPVDPMPPIDEPVRPEDLPSEDQAKQIALDLLEKAGADLEGAEVRADDGTVEWYVSVEPKVDGLRAIGLSMYANVGDEGRITSASGTLAKPVKLGDYPLLDTRAALDRLNEQRVYFGPAVDMALDDTAGAAEADPVTTVPGEPETTVPGDPDVSILPVPEDPTVTAPVEPPPDVPVTGAEVVLSVEYATDGSATTYLVPSYQFTAGDQTDPYVNAVVDDLVEEPEPGPTTDTTVEMPPPTGGIEPAPDGGTEPGTEPNTGGGTDPDPGEPTAPGPPDVEPGLEPTTTVSTG